MRGEFNGFFIISREKWGEILDYVSCFPKHFFRALTDHFPRALQQNGAQTRLLYLLGNVYWTL